MEWTHTVHLCGILAKIRHCANFESLKEVYHALFYLYIRYGIVTWGNVSEILLNTLRVLNHWAVRIMTFAPFGRIDVKTWFKLPYQLHFCAKPCFFGGALRYLKMVHSCRKLLVVFKNVFRYTKLSPEADIFNFFLQPMLF